MSGWQQKIYNYEQLPPEGVWEKISGALDESHLADEFPSALYKAETMPPSSAWENISRQLDSGQTPLVHLSRNRFVLFRYAAAALIIGLVTFGIIKWSSTKNNSTTATVSPKATEIVQKTNNLPRNNNLPSVSHEMPAQDDENSTEKDITEKNSPVKKLKKDFSGQDAEPVYAYNENSPQQLADRYIMLLTPNGVVRMSKKLGDLVCCVSGQEQDEDCKDQLKRWQEKMASSPITPSPGNFMDILSLVNALNENDL